MFVRIMWGKLMVKCIVTDCNKEAETGIPWCEEHLNELGDYIDEHPIGGTMIKKFEQWKIQEQDHHLCYYCENGWCNNKEIECTWNKCDLRVEGSHVCTDKYGNILRTL